MAVDIIIPSDPNKISTDQIGAANGVVPLDGTSKIPSAFLPSYVDDVIEVATFSALPAIGEQGKIYVTIDTNFQYRWSGSSYVKISNPVDFATQAEAEGNVENTKAMTALRVFQNWINNISNYVVDALTTANKTIVGAINELNAGVSTKANALITINTYTASSTLALVDNNALVQMNVAGANNITIPPNITVAFAVGSQILVEQYGAGQTTIVAGAGVTIRAANSWLKFNARYATATLLKIGADEWLVSGNLNA